MTFSVDVENNGVKFEVEADGNTYKGTLTIEAIKDHFDFSSHEVDQAERFCSEYHDEVAEEIRIAIRRHPPIFGTDHILLLPHHMR